MNKEFLKAVQAGDSAKVRSLLDRDPSLRDARDPDGIHAAVVALYYGHRDIAEEILARGPTLDLHAAASLGRLDRVRDLVEEDPTRISSYSPDGFPPLGLAAYTGQAEVVEYLLAKGADANQVARNRGRFTALTGAVSSGHREVAARLLAAGADPNYWYQGGATPVLVAAANGDVAMLELLVAHGGDVAAETEQGKTAVSWALENGHAEAAEWLRQHGAQG